MEWAIYPREYLGDGVGDIPKRVLRGWDGRYTQVSREYLAMAMESSLAIAKSARLDLLRSVVRLAYSQWATYRESEFCLKKIEIQ